MLLARGLIEAEDLERALELQKERGDKIGKILADMGFIAMRDVLAALSEQLAVPLAVLDAPPPAAPELEGLSPRFMRQARFLPVALDDSTVTIAMADPLDFETLAAVRSFCGLKVKAALAGEQEILDAIEQEDPNLAESVRHLMFVFEDMLLIDTTALKEVLSKVDRKMLTLALKGTSEQLQNHFIQCMSQRGAEMLREDMDAMGPVRIRDVESAQQQIIAIVRQLESQGVISLKGAVGEQYVV
jgi:hypothetical protein